VTAPTVLSGKAVAVLDAVREFLLALESAPPAPAPTPASPAPAPLAAGPARLFYRAKEFQKMVGISATTFYRLIQDGELKTVKLLGSRLIPVAEAEAFAAKLLRQMGTA
jgi:excisionase family DNA binding protein